jgi:hypothetical protein
MQSYCRRLIRRTTWYLSPEARRRVFVKVNDRYLDWYEGLFPLTLAIIPPQLLRTAHPTAVMKAAYFYELAPALSLLTTVSGDFMFAASADAHCQNILSIVNVTDGNCIGDLAPFKSVWPMSTYFDSAAQGRFCGACDWEGGCDVFWLQSIEWDAGQVGAWEVSYDEKDVWFSQDGFRVLSRP